jgi:fructose 1,6-bisphosphatase
MFATLQHSHLIIDAQDHKGFAFEVHDLTTQKVIFHSPRKIYASWFSSDLPKYGDKAGTQGPEQ